MTRKDFFKSLAGFLAIPFVSLAVAKSEPVDENAGHQEEQRRYKEAFDAFDPETIRWREDFAYTMNDGRVAHVVTATVTTEDKRWAVGREIGPGKSFDGPMRERMIRAFRKRAAMIATGQA